MKAIFFALTVRNPPRNSLAHLFIPGVLKKGHFNGLCESKATQFTRSVGRDFYFLQTASSMQMTSNSSPRETAMIFSKTP